MYVYTNIQIYMHKHTYVYMCLCMCMHTYMRVRAHTHTKTHTQAHLVARSKKLVHLPKTVAVHGYQIASKSVADGEQQCLVI